MKKLSRLLYCAAAALLIGGSHTASAARYVGGDISMLPEYEKAGAIYKDADGKTIADMIPWCAQQGMNSMRVRVFVNPAKYKELHPNDSDPDVRYDPNACQDIESVIPLCKRIVDSGMKLMLDFHYSDTWADPAKQWTPYDWQGLTDEQLYQKIYDYTKESLQKLKANGIVPAFIQTGNEISYGMLWGGLESSNLKKVYTNSSANWERFGKLLQQAGKACREVCPQAQIVIHTERVAQVTVLKDFYARMKSLNIDYDIIGLSYYPYFHGDMNVLDSALSMLQKEYPSKQIMIVETGYSYKWEVPGTTINLTNKWPYSEAGQDKFASDLVNTLLKYENVDGLYWWWMEYNAFNTKLSGWYNAPLFDSTTGKVTLAFKTICSFGDQNGLSQIVYDPAAADSRWYDLTGRQISAPTAPGLYIHDGRKVLITP